MTIDEDEELEDEDDEDEMAAKSILQSLAFELKDSRAGVF